MGGTNFQLKPHSKIPKPQKPLLVVVLDGWGQAADDELLKAHGTAVGLPSDDDMGNSEVCLGHSPPTLSYRENLFAGFESRNAFFELHYFNQCPRHL
jgi:hypothetical protein